MKKDITRMNGMQADAGKVFDISIYLFASIHFCYYAIFGPQLK